MIADSEALSRAVSLCILPTTSMLIGSLIILKWQPGGKLTSALQHFAAGVVFSAIGVELLPEITKKHDTNSNIAITIGFLVGIILMFIVGRCFELDEDEDSDDEEEMELDVDITQYYQTDVKVSSHGMPEPAASASASGSSSTQYKMQESLSHDSFQNALQVQKGGDSQSGSASTTPRAGRRQFSRNSSRSRSGSRSRFSERNSRLEAMVSRSRCGTPKRTRRSRERSTTPGLNDVEKADYSSIETPSTLKDALTFDSDDEITSEPHSMLYYLPWGMMAAVAVDAFMDGLLIGIASVAGTTAGGILAFSLMIEMCFLGISTSGALYKKADHIPAWVRVLICIGLPLFIIIGGVAGSTVMASLSGPSFVAVLSFGMAALLYLVTEELLLEAHENPQDDTWLVSIQFFSGFLMTLMLKQVAAANDDATGMTM